MSGNPETWCERDEHNRFECFIDFNDWLDGSDDDAKAIRFANGVGKVSQPSKALFASDKEAYEQVFRAYRIRRRHEVLSGEYIEDTFGDDHWFARNEQRFDQLVLCLLEGSVVPFIGAGVSVAGGFPTWRNHLREQGKTAGIDSSIIEDHLAKGEYEAVIEIIEDTRGADVFVQEIRDAFSKAGSLEDITLIISELFSDTLITTNYDHLLEQSFDIGPGEEVQVINSTEVMEQQPDPNKVTIIKLHGDIRAPQRCILGKRHYNEAYGEIEIDLTKPIPKLLRYHYTTSSLLFIGCSLNNDRTIQVFKAVKTTLGDNDRPEHFSIEEAPDKLADLIARNAELLELGITPIWYPKRDYDKVEAILRHALNELKYKQSDPYCNVSPRGETKQPASTLASLPDHSVHSMVSTASARQTSRTARFLKAALTFFGLRANALPTSDG